MPPGEQARDLNGILISLRPAQTKERLGKITRGYFSQHLSQACSGFCCHAWVCVTKLVCLLGDGFQPPGSLSQDAILVREITGAVVKNLTGEMGG